MTWQVPKTWSGEGITDDKLNEQLRDNMSALKAPPTSVTAANTSNTVTSTSFVDQFSLTDFQTYGGDVLFMAQVLLTVASGIGYFDVSLDGNRQGGTDGILAFQITTSIGVTVIWLFQDVAPGLHDFALMNKTTGSFTYIANGQYTVREIS